MRVGDAFNRVLLSKCEAIWVYTGRVSAGMRAEIEWVHHLELPIRYFTAGFEEAYGTDDHAYRHRHRPAEQRPLPEPARGHHCG
ncbi:DUF7768 domain-containing protein [Cutibacterium porci]